MKYKGKNKILTLLITTSLLLAMIAVFPSVMAAGTCACTSDTPGYIAASSASTSIIKLAVQTDVADDYFDRVWIDFSGSGFDTGNSGDLLALANDHTSGVSIWKDTSDDGSFSSSVDSVVGASTNYWDGNTVKITLGHSGDSQLDQTGVDFIFFVVIKTASDISDDDYIQSNITRVEVDLAASTISGTTNVTTIADTQDPSVASDVVVSPNGGEFLSTTQTITWNSSDITDSHLATNPITLYYSNDSGTNWVQIATGQANSGTYSTWDTSALDDGANYLINITAVDNASNSAYDISNATFTVDNTHPTVDIEYNRSATYFAAGTAIKIYANFTESGGSGMDNSTVNISIDAAGSGDLAENTMNMTSITNYCWNWTIPSGTGNDGAFTVNITGQDNASNALAVSPATDNSKTIDNSAPTAAISVPADATTWYASMDSISGTCGDGSGSGVNKVNITIYNATSGKYWNSTGWDTGVNWTEITSLGGGGTTWTWTSSGVTWYNGTQYFINATATDNVSNVGTAVSNNFTLDSNGLTSNASTISPYWQTSSSVSIDFEATDYGSGLHNVSLYYRYSSTNASASWGDWTYSDNDTSPWDPTAWTFTFGYAGYYEFYTIATDNSTPRNTESAPSNDGNDTICGYDPDAPTGTIVLPVDNAYYKPGDLITTKINGTVNDPRNVTNAYIEILNNTGNTYFNGSTWIDTYINLSTNLSGTAPLLEWVYDNGSAFPTWLHNQTYYINLSSVDTAGNWNNSTASASFLYDDQNPTASVSLPVNTTYYSTLANITGTSNDDGESGISTVNLTIFNQTGSKYWNGSDWGSSNLVWLSTTGTTSWYYDTAFPTWTNGSTYYINATATDNAGNIGNSYWNYFIYDNNSINSNASTISPYWQTSSSVSIDFEATDYGSGLHNVSLYYRYSSTNASASWGDWTYSDNDTSPWDPTAWTFTFGSAGYYEFYTIATDNSTPRNTESAPSNDGNDTICGYDDTNPFVNITSFTNNSYHTSMDYIAGDCSDSGTSGVKEVNITIFNSSANKYWTGSAWGSGVSWCSTTLSSGNTIWNYTSGSSVTWDDTVSYIINATTTDNASRTSTADSKTFTIDTTAPTVVVEMNSGDYVKNGDTVKVFANFTEATSGIDHTTVLVTVDTAGTDVAATLMNMTDNTHWWYNWNVPSGSDGTANVSVAASDNVSYSLTGTTWNTTKTIDNTAPICSIDFNISRDYYRDADSVRIFANFTETGSGITDSPQISINYASGPDDVDATSMTETNNTRWYYNMNVPSGADGQFTVNVTATDNASNNLATNPTTDSTKYVDNTDPTGNIATPTNGGYYDESLTNLSGVVNDSQSVSSTVTITIYNTTGGTYFTGTAWQASVSNLTANTSIVTSVQYNWWYEDTTAYPTFTDGSNYTVNLTATDTAGNSAQVDGNTFYYDTGGPTISNVLITDITTGSTTYIKNGDTFNVTATVTDANLASGDTSYIKADLTSLNGSATVSADGYDGTTAYWNSTVTTFANTTITVTINASDKSGNYATEVNDTIIQDDTPPTLSYAVMDADNDGNSISYVDVYFSETTMNTSTIAYTDFNVSKTGISAASIPTKSGNLVTIAFDGKFETGNSPTIGIPGSIEDLAGNELTDSTITINTYRISLVENWNLISIPADTSGSTISTVLPDDFEANLYAIWGYNAATDTWSYWQNSGHDGNLNLEPGKGYWVNMTTADTLIGNYNLWPIGGTTPPEVTIEAQSWNLVGHFYTWNMTANISDGLSDFVSDDIAGLYRYNPTGASYTDIFNTGTLEPGKGYWLSFKGTTDKKYNP